MRILLRDGLLAFVKLRSVLNSRGQGKGGADKEILLAQLPSPDIGKKDQRRKQQIAVIYDASTGEHIA